MEIAWNQALGTAANLKINVATNGGLGIDGLDGTADDFPDDNPPTLAAKGGLVTATVASAAGTYDWTVPDIMTKSAVLRIAKVGDTGETYDDSDTYFYISGSLTSVYVKDNVLDGDPPSPIDLPIANVKQITWDYTGRFGTVSLYYPIVSDQAAPAA